MINLHWLYVLAGAVFAGFALSSARDRTNPKRWGNAAFWGLLAVELLVRRSPRRHRQRRAGPRPWSAIAGFASARPQAPGRRPRAQERESRSDRLGNKLFLPALIIPFTALRRHACCSTTRRSRTLGWIDPKRVTLVLLGLGVIARAGHLSTPGCARPRSRRCEEGRRLIDAIGWAAVLPQMLAALGVMFAAAGVGTTIGALAGAIIPHGSVFLAVAAVTRSAWSLFTMIMGNAFAAFPVMAAAIGVPILIQADGGNPAVIGAVGMLAGFCGTLMTPMAANFNIVPAALLELKDQYGVIKAQVADGAAAARSPTS